MKVKLRGLLFIVMSMAFTQHVLAQAPNISYSPATYVLATGTPISIGPFNSGGAVPANIYGQVTTVAGRSGSNGYTNATGTSARFNAPQAIVGDVSGNLYIADANNNAIRKITSTGVVTTFAGSATGVSGSADGTGTSALFNGPDGLAIDGSGNLFVADFGNGSIREITSAGVVTTFVSGLSGPTGLSFDGSGNLIVAVFSAPKIIKISPAGIVTTVAGNGTASYVNATGTAARFYCPEGAQPDASGNLFVADYLNNAIRKISTAGVVTTFAGSSTNGNTGGYAAGVGTAAKFNNPTSVALTSFGIVYVTDFLNNDIRKITPDGNVTLVAGSPGQIAGSANGTGTTARFNQPDAIYIDGAGNGYFTEYSSIVRKVVLTGYALNGTLPPGLTFDATTGIISGSATGSFTTLTDTITAYNTSGYSAATVTFSPSATIMAPNIAYTMETDTLSVGTAFSFSPTNSGGPVPAVTYAQVTTIAGNTTGGYVNSTGSSARFNAPMAIIGDASGNLYIADANNNVIRKISPSGTVTTFAGSATGTSGYTDATGTSALFNAPDGLAFDAAANLYVADFSNNAIRKITPAGIVTTFYHSTGTFGPAGLIVDGTGNVIVAAQDLSQILKITPAGVVTTIAGSSSGYLNGTGTSAMFASPTDVKMDASGNLFVADYLNNAIRKITPSGVVTTLAGSTVSGNAGGYADSVGTAARFNNPTGLAITSGGVIYVTDINNNAVRRIMPDGTVSLAAGSASHAAGSTDGTGTAALFNQPDYLYIDGNGNGFVTELAGNKIRKIALTGYSLSGTLPAGITFDSTSGKISGTPTGFFLPMSLTVEAFNTTGNSFVILSVSVANNWLGLTDDWGNASNWDQGHVPLPSNEIAQIGVKAYTGSFQPVVSLDESPSKIMFGPFNSPVLTIKAGKTLTVNAGLQVKVSSAAIIQGPGNLTLTGASLINPSASLTATLNLNIILTGSSSITNAGSFTLASDANGSASIAAIPGTSSIVGPVSVQRFITGGIGYRGYRLLSSPVYATTVSSNNVYTIDYLLNSIYVLGTTGTSGGFIQTGNPTLYLFRENMDPCDSSFTCGNWRGINNILTSPTYSLDEESSQYNIPVGNGYLCFFRGDKNAATVAEETVSTYVPTKTFLTATGTLNQGRIVVKDWFTPGSSILSYTNSPTSNVVGSNCIGNPYPSSIDWDTFSSTVSTSGIYGPSVSDFVSEYNPTQGTYGSYEAGSGGTGTNGATRFIPSGSGFFVTALNASASLTFNESAKSTAQLISGQQLLMSTVAPKKNYTQYLRLQMFMDSTDNEDILIRFNTMAPTSFNPHLDALYKRGFGNVSLSSLSSDHFQLAINSQPLPITQPSIIGLNVAAAQSGTYSLKLLQLTGLPKLYDVWLMDGFKKDSINMRLNNSYNFDIDIKNKSSFSADRFSLIIRQNPAYAYQLLNFTADKVQNANQVQVAWKTQNEENYTNFTVQRSTDGGKTFDVLGNDKAAGQGTYSLLDKNPVIGQNSYRLKQENVNNVVTYSKIVTIQYSNLGDQSLTNQLKVYPNPASSVINLSFVANENQSDSYKVRISSSMGNVVREVNIAQASWEGNVSNLLPGTYLVRIIDNKTQSVIAENKFVKL